MKAPKDARVASIPNEAWAITGEPVPASKATKLLDQIHHHRADADALVARWRARGYDVRVVRLLIQIEEIESVWRCQGCGEMFDEPQSSHGRAAHSYGCDGTCKSCPVEVECGPIEEIEAGEDKS